MRALAKAEGVAPKDFSNAVCKPSKVAKWREEYEARAAAAAEEAQAAAAAEGEGEEEEGAPAKRARLALV